MADVRTVMFRPLDGAQPTFDWSLLPPSLEGDDGLETAVILSLFTDRRAEADDVLPDGSDDRRGWWADAFPDVEGDRIGSRLWLLFREKDMRSVVNRAREYCIEALQWMLDEGVASKVEVLTGWVDRVSQRVTEAKSAQSMPGVLGIAIAITRPDGATHKFRFDKFWSQQ